MTITTLGAGQPSLAGAITFAFGANFNGSTYLSRGATPTGLVDGSQGTLSFWAKPASFGTSMFVTTNATIVFRVQKTGGDSWQVVVSDASGSTFNFQTLNAYSSAVWLNVLASWDTNFAAGSKLGQLYISDVSDFSVNSDASAAFNVNYNDGNLSIGARQDTGGVKFGGDLAEFWFNPARIDLSVTANRRKFISATGHPVDLGSTGQTPTGASPILYQSIRSPFGVASDFLTNRGTGGDFTVTAGSLSLSGTNP